jgi:hypothetical protein
MSGSGSCGCCACLAGAGIPAGTYNRPGLSSIRYRTGTHSTFFDAMIRRLTVPVELEQSARAYSLHALTTREHDDPAIALLDAWATTADVLTFYQERIANESYLRTATERRSLLELGRLVGYTLKQGVSASAYLAYTIDDGVTTIIPAGSKSQSIPGTNEQAQTFETSEDIEARGSWNTLRPRMRRPQRINVDVLEDRTNDKGEMVPTLIDNVLEIDSVWIDGTNTLFEKRDPLLFVFAAENKALKDRTVYAVRRVLKTVTDTELDRTEIVLEPVRPYYINLYRQALVAAKAQDVGVPPVLSVAGSGALSAVARKPRKSAKERAAVTAGLSVGESVDGRAATIGQLLREILLGTSRTVLITRFTSVSEVDGVLTRDDVDVTRTPPAPADVSALFGPLTAARAQAPRGEFQFARSLDGTLGPRSDARLRLLAAFHPELGPSLYTALANAGVGNKPYRQLRGLFVLRRHASVFGYNAPDSLFRPSIDQLQQPSPDPVEEKETILYLDTPDEKITAGSYALIGNSSGTLAAGTRVVKVLETATVARAAYFLSGKSSRLTLDEPWSDDLREMPEDEDKLLEALKHNLAVIRGTSVFVQSEELTLAQQRIDRPVGRPAAEGDSVGESRTRIELDPVVDGLTAGRWVIVRGERLVGGTSGVIAAELAMVANVELQASVDAGGTAFSILVLALEGLAYEYERSSVEIFANVAAATHGESHGEILGSGSASKPMQTFTLHHTPLTFVAAPTVDGVRSTLSVRVDDALWLETDSPAYAGPGDRVYTTRAADDGKVSVTFGDGTHGQRLYSGTDNVRAAYRTGIGRAGNVRAGQIATAISRPLGVKEVVNPTEASGGADPESAGEARRNIPVSLQAMGRVVSVGDFADFARTFAGIAKATATLLAADRMRFVHLTIGGAGDITIDEHSDLHRNLVESLRKYGDPYQPFVVRLRERIVITGAARVRVSADQLWSLVAPKVRAALVETFSYERRDFGQPVFPAEVIAAIQNLPGVEYVDLDRLEGVREEDVRRSFTASAETSTVFAGSAALLQNVAIGSGFPAPPPKLDCDGGRAILPKFARPPAGRRTRPLLPVEFLPAEIAYLPPELADLFILTEIDHD